MTVYCNLQHPARAFIEPAKSTKRESDVEFAAKCAGTVLGGLGTLEESLAISLQLLLV